MNNLHDPSERQTGQCACRTSYWLHDDICAECGITYDAWQDEMLARDKMCESCGNLLFDKMSFKSELGTFCEQCERRHLYREHHRMIELFYDNEE